MNTPATCPTCDLPAQLTPQGICAPCQDGLRFVTRPAAHRELYRREVAAQAGFRREMEQRGVVVISSVPADNDEWICDFCNHQIPVSAEHCLIPLLGSYALCGNCVTRVPYWPDAWTHPEPRACRCDACQTPLHRLALRDHLNRHLNETATERTDRPRRDRGLER